MLLLAIDIDFYMKLLAISKHEFFSFQHFADSVKTFFFGAEPGPGDLATGEMQPWRLQLKRGTLMVLLCNVNQKQLIHSNLYFFQLFTLIVCKFN